jgi:hypothetical protein
MSTTDRAEEFLEMSGYGTWENLVAASIKEHQRRVEEWEKKEYKPLPKFHQRQPIIHKLEVTTSYTANQIRMVLKAKHPAPTTNPARKRMARTRAMKKTRNGMPRESRKSTANKHVLSMMPKALQTRLWAKETSKERGALSPAMTLHPIQMRIWTTITILHYGRITISYLLLIISLGGGLLGYIVLVI